jgi:hypothetical protein
MGAMRARSPLALLVLLGATSCTGLHHASDPAPVVRGPLSARQQHPMALTLMAFRPRRPVTQAEGTTGVGTQLSWSSIEEIQRNPPYAPDEFVSMDTETVRLALRARHGVTEDLDLEVELPVLLSGSGALDRFIEEFHDLFGLPAGGRHINPDDQHQVRVESGGELLYELDEGLGLQDIPVLLTWAVRREDEGGPGVALRAGLELPTGSQSRGLGNGALDIGAGVLAERSLGRWTIIGGADIVVPGQSDLMEATSEHRYETMYAAELTGEYRWNDGLSLVATTKWTSQMLGSMPLEEIHREVFDLGLGAIWDLDDRSRLALSLHEDLVAATGSDFTVQVGYTVGY